MATWPASLPQFPLVTTPNIGPEDVRAAFGAKVGPETLRERTTSAGQEITAVYGMTDAQIATLSTFWKTTISHGTVSVDMPHPKTGTTETFVFLAPPATVETTANFHRVTISMYQEA